MFNGNKLIISLMQETGIRSVLGLSEYFSIARGTFAAINKTNSCNMGTLNKIAKELGINASDVVKLGE